METPARHSFTLDGTARVFPIPSNLKGDNYVRLEVDGVIINDRSKYDIVNNAIVFNSVLDLPSGSQLDVLVVQSEEAIGQLAITSNIDVVASHITDVNTVGANITAVTTNASNITVIQNAEANAASALASKNAAATSATNASTSASTATTQAGIATTQAGIATTKASEASTSASNALTSANNASTSETNANASASSASTSASNASTSASTATTQAGIATTKASEASTSASNASASASSASTSASTATTQASNASTSASAASASASSASTSASNASASASNASLSETNAATSETNAATSASEAAASATLAEAFGLPDPTGHSGKYLGTDGTETFWDVVDTGVSTLNGQTGTIISTDLYAIGSYVTGRTNNFTTTHTVDSLLSGSQLYSVSSCCFYQSGSWGFYLSSGFFSSPDAATLVNVGTWRCVSPAAIINNRGATGLWVRIS